MSVLFTLSTPSKMQLDGGSVVQVKLDAASAISPKEALFEQ